jgi:uncharacterized protein (DUF58 family)
MIRPRAAVELEHAGIRFPPDFARRLERIVLRVRAARERREGAGSAALAGRGDEFVGYRPYRPGEDMAPLDWSLLARLDRPYVRVTRREASESWAILLDSSASMGVGPPGKLEACAMLSSALAALALREGARVTIALTDSDSGSRTEFRVRSKSDLQRLLVSFEATRASGDRGIARALATWRPPAEAGRVFVCGDLLDVEASDLAVLRRRGRELFAVQVLAPIELAPPVSAAVEWVDPENGERVDMELGASSVAAYRRELETVLEGWRLSCARHGIAHLCASSAQPFEDLLPRLFGLPT